MRVWRAGLVRIAAAGALFLGLGAAEAFAQGGFGLDVEAGWRNLEATKSAKAIFGSDSGSTFGGSVQYSLERGLFLRAGLRTFAKEGERVFLADASSTPFPLGFPLEISIRSVDLLAGWRFRLGGRKPKPLVPYVALGAELASYEEESTVAGLVETNEANKTGFQFVGGLEYQLFDGKLAISAEGGYSMVGSALGVGGVSKIYGEDGIGGFRVMGRLGYRF